MKKRIALLTLAAAILFGMTFLPWAMHTGPTDNGLPRYVNYYQTIFSSGNVFMPISGVLTAIAFLAALIHLTGERRGWPLTCGVLLLLAAGCTVAAVFTPFSASFTILTVVITLGQTLCGVFALLVCRAMAQEAQRPVGSKIPAAVLTGAAAVLVVLACLPWALRLAAEYKGHNGFSDYFTSFMYIRNYCVTVSGLLTALALLFALLHLFGALRGRAYTCGILLALAAACTLMSFLFRMEGSFTLLTLVITVGQALAAAYALCGCCAKTAKNEL